MTLEELQAQLAAAQQELADERAAKETLSNNERQQNSYITKMEAKIKQLEEAMDNVKNVASAPVVDTGSEDVVNYVRKQIRRDVMREGIETIKANAGEEIYRALEKDFLAFIEDTMGPDSQSVQYMVDAFALVYGRASIDKTHAIHTIGQAQPTPQVNIDQLRNMRPTAPVMTGQDTGASQGMGAPQHQPVRNTNDAIRGLKERFRQAGANRFQ